MAEEISREPNTYYAPWLLAITLTQLYSEETSRTKKMVKKVKFERKKSISKKCIIRAKTCAERDKEDLI